MRKGKLGIVLSFYTVLAFVLAALGQTLLCAILLGVVLIVEKDEWTSKQVMQGFFLALFNSVVDGAISILNITKFTDVYMPGFLRASSIITELAWILVVVFAIIGIVNTAKGNDAKVPCFSSLAERAFGHIPFVNNNGGYNAPNNNAPTQSPYEQTSENSNTTTKV